MNAKQLIDLVLTYTDNISATDADNSTRRARTLQSLQEIFDYVWWHHAWAFKMETATVTLPAGTPSSPSRIALPADFGSIGPLGAVFVVATGDKITETGYSNIRRFQQDTSLVLSYPEHYCIAGDYSDAAYLLQTENVSGSVSLRVDYEATSPTLADVDHATNSYLQKIPAKYHTLVLLPGVVSKSQRSKGDTRDWAAEYGQGLTTMIAKENPVRASVQRLPKSFPGRSW